jgi:hypothetical protein
MFILPLKGDKIETKDGVEFTVLSFTNYRDKGPAVYVEHTPEVPSDAVYFFDIAKIGGKTVEWVPGAKVFRAAGQLKRRFQLPQMGDIITIRGNDGLDELKVVGLKLHKKGDLAKGLFVIGVKLDDADEVKQFVRLDQLIDLKRDIGNDLFSRDRFLSYYSDYRGAK